MYTSLKKLYKSLMFPKVEGMNALTMNEIDEMDSLFFYELMNEDDEEEGQYLSDVW